MKAERSPQREKERVVEMDFAGDPRVVENILTKNYLLEKEDPNHKRIRTSLVIPGGVQRGVVPAGVAIGLERRDLVKAFTHFVTSSSGSPIAYYTLAGEAAKGTTIYYEENVANQFINFGRVSRIGDIDGLEMVIRNKKPINIETLRSSRPAFLVSVTDWRTGEGRFVDAKSYADPFEPVVASMLMPFLSGRRVLTIDGERVVDGAIGNPLPISYCIDELGSTDILVALTSTLAPKVANKSFEGAFFGGPMIQRFGRPIWKALGTAATRYNEELKYLTGEKRVPKGVRIAAIYPRVMPIGVFTMDSELLRHGTQKATEFTENLFSFPNVSSNR